MISASMVSCYLCHFWHAPLWVHSTKHRHQSPEWAILSQVSCFVQGEVKWFQVLLNRLHPHVARASWWSPPVLQAVKVFASVSSGRHTVWSNKERRCAWTMVERVVAWLSLVCLNHELKRQSLSITQGETPCLDNGWEGRCLVVSGLFEPRVETSVVVTHISVNCSSSLDCVVCFQCE